MQTLFRYLGSRVAMQNSNATSDAELHPQREVPIWDWPKETAPRC
jgi:hypothetical protein